MLPARLPRRNAFYSSASKIGALKGSPHDFRQVHHVGSSTLSFTEQIIGLAINVHRGLEPGLLESVYETYLAFELKQARILFSQTHEAQVLTYLRMSGCRGALPLNFNESRLKDGLRRFANTQAEEIN